MESDVRQLYRAARKYHPAGTPVTVLHIGSRETVVATGDGAEPENVLLLAIGSQKTATDFFLHIPPAPAEIENAIMQVEDEISRAREMIAGYPTLVTADASIREIALIADGRADPPRQLAIEAVEQLFSLLAGRSQGRPAAISGIPDSPGFAAALLILREFMHHSKFLSVAISA